MENFQFDKENVQPVGIQGRVFVIIIRLRNICRQKNGLEIKSDI